MLCGKIRRSCVVIGSGIDPGLTLCFNSNCCRCHLHSLAVQHCHLVTRLALLASLLMGIKFATWFAAMPNCANCPVAGSMIKGSCRSCWPARARLPTQSFSSHPAAHSIRCSHSDMRYKQHLCSPEGAWHPTWILYAVCITEVCQLHCQNAVHVMAPALGTTFNMLTSRSLETH